MVVYMTSYQVFTSPITTRLEVFNELVLFLIGFNMVTLMSEGNINKTKRDHLGVSLVTFTITLCVINSLKFVYD